MKSNENRYQAEMRLSHFPPEERAKVLTMRPEIREMMYTLLSIGYDKDVLVHRAMQYLLRGDATLEEMLVMVLDAALKQKDQMAERLTEIHQNSPMPQIIIRNGG